MKKVNFVFRLTLSIIMVLNLSRCVSVRTFHNDKVDIGFLKNKGEVNFGASFDTNDETSGINGNVMFSPAEHLLIGAGYSFFSYNFLHREHDANDPGFDEDEDKGQLEGYKLRANIGYYNNFGREGTNYLETMFTASYGQNHLKLGVDGSNSGFNFYEYRPFSIAGQIGIGKNLDNIAFLGGIKLQYYNFQEQIPLVRDGGEPSTTDGIVIGELFMGARFGNGPVKGNVQISISNNLTSAFYDSEPIPAVSAGISFVFGRKKEITL